VEEEEEEEEEEAEAMAVAVLYPHNINISVCGCITVLAGGFTDEGEKVDTAKVDLGTGRRAQEQRQGHHECHHGADYVDVD
jgi:hypothetical protein